MDTVIRTRGPCLLPGRGKERLDVRNCVDPMAWHIGPTKVQVSSGQWCTLRSSCYERAEPICVSGATGGSQQLVILKAKVSLIGNKWQEYQLGLASFNRGNCNSTGCNQSLQTRWKRDKWLHISYCCFPGSASSSLRLPKKSLKTTW